MIVLNNKDHALKFLNEIEPPMENGTPDKDRMYRYGGINAIISNYSTQLICLLPDEDMVNRCEKGYDFMKISEKSPYSKLDAHDIIFQSYEMDREAPTLDVVIDLMVGFVEYLNENNKTS